MKFRWYAVWLGLVCACVFIIQYVFSGFTEIFVLTSDSFAEPWRFVSAIFLHGGLGHLLYNLFALLLFGSILEKKIGSRNFLALFFVSGIFANLISVFFYPSSLGASGAIFGVIGALVLVNPSLVVWAFGLPMPIYVAGILWAAGDLIGAVAYLSGNPISNTGNIAHLLGMLAGVVYGVFYRFRKNKDGKEIHIKDNSMNLHEPSVRRWEDYYLRDARY